jgi:organic radical activating enzyme
MHGRNKQMLPIGNWLNLLINGVRKNQALPLYIFIYGGEPTMYDNLRTFVEKINEILVQNNDFKSILEIQSNFAKDSSYFQDLLETLKKRQNSYLSLSYHYEFANFEIFLSKLNKLYKLYPDQFKTIMFMYQNKEKSLENLKIINTIIPKSKIEISPIMNCLLNDDTLAPSDNIKRLQADKDSLAKYVNLGTFLDKHISVDNLKLSRLDVWYYNMNKFKGYLCDISKYKFVVNFDGNLYNCSQDIVFQNKELINVKDITERWLKEYFKQLHIIRCPYRACAFDLEYPKRRSFFVHF